MAQVTVTINARTYKMICGDGQEEHLIQLASKLNDRVTELTADFGQVGDTKLLLMAAIMAIDEVEEMKRRGTLVDDELERMRNARETVASRLEAAQDSVARTLVSAAERIEGLNVRLRGDEL